MSRSILAVIDGDLNSEIMCDPSLFIAGLLVEMRFGFLANHIATLKNLVELITAPGKQRECKVLLRLSKGAEVLSWKCPEKEHCDEYPRNVSGAGNQLTFCHNFCFL